MNFFDLNNTNHCPCNTNSTITCTKCGYTELYKSDRSAGMNILDFLAN